MASARVMGVLLSLLGATFMSGCSGDANSPPPLQATASSSVGCSKGEAYEHTTLGYHVCFPTGWISRDYTAEPGAGGAVSVVVFGPPAAVPPHVPASGSFTPPIEVRVVAGPKDQVETSLAQGNQVSQTRIAGVAADKILVTTSGPASGAVIIVFEHQTDTYEMEEAPGGDDAAFQLVLDSFSFLS